MKEQSTNPRASIIPRLMQLNATLWRVAPAPNWQTWMDMELTMSQFKLLLLIASSDGSRVGDLAHWLGVTPPTVTTILDRLVAHELVRREDDPVDRRLVIARLTGQGRGLLQRLGLYTRTDLADCMNALDDEDLRSLLIGMEALHRVWQARHTGHANGSATEPDEC